MLHNALGRVAVGRGRLTGAVSVAADVGVFTLTGNDATLRYVRRLSLSAEAGSLTLTGQSSKRLLSIRANAGAFSLSGQAATLRSDRILYATGNVTTAASSTRSFLTSALGRIALGSGGAGSQTAATTFILTGQIADLNKFITLTADVGSFVLTFQDNRLEFAGRPPHIRAFPRVSKPMRTYQRGATQITAKAGGGGFKARAYGG
jgi:hypothetical protein